MNIEIDYPPDFAVRYGYGKPSAKYIAASIARYEDTYSEWLETILSVKEALSSIQIIGDRDGEEPFWDNNWFPPLDGAFTFASLVSKKPRLLIEIGSGNSTKFARKAIKDYRLKTKLISIDPYPRAEIDKLSDEIIRQPLEHADLDVFFRLTRGDFLFFDGSHRSFQNSDVTVFFHDVLPSLPKGVYVGIHDIYWPNDYPVTWKERYYNEQYMLGAYMLGARDKFKTVFPGAHLTSSRQHEVRSALPAFVTDHFVAKNSFIGGSAFWFKT